jgi:hypothetical protein
MTDVVMGCRVLWVIRICSGEGGKFPTVRSREKCRRVNFQVLKNSGLRRSMCYIREEAEAPKSLKWIYTIDLGEEIDRWIRMKLEQNHWIKTRVEVMTWYEGKRAPEALKFVVNPDHPSRETCVNRLVVRDFSVREN